MKSITKRTIALLLSLVTLMTTLAFAESPETLENQMPETAAIQEAIASALETEVVAIEGEESQSLEDTLEEKGEDYIEEPIDEPDEEEAQEPADLPDISEEEPVTVTTPETEKPSFSEGLEAEGAPFTEPDGFSESPEPEETSIPAMRSLKETIETDGYAYVMAQSAVTLYGAADLSEAVYTLAESESVLLAVAYVEQEESCVQVMLLTEEYEPVTAYAAVRELENVPLTDEEIAALSEERLSALVCSDEGERLLFVAVGEKTEMQADAPVPDTISSEPDEMPLVVPTETAQTEETPAPEVQIGAFVAVSPQTRVFLGVDDTATDEECGNLNLGVFVNEAVVQVETVEQDGMGRSWYKVRYMYGADDADGSLIWTAYGTVYVLASETQETQEQDFTVTDYAFSELPASSMRRAARADAPRMQTLSGNTGSFSAGQTKYAYSGHDSEYLQIATLKGYGAIYATPHYVDEHTVYCLEHTMNSPGVRDNATGPYAVVDLSGYERTPGYSGIIYGEDTMHAIGWVLRHTYPFMALDRYEDSCLEWSRVAGQFAIREVIKQMEGAQYVRDYWDMDSFYRASGQAPKEYLEYARWLAAEGIAHGNITGDISVSNKSVSIANGVCTCTVTLTTDADRIRISRSAGTITGNTGGEDGDYYYLNSGDTITVSSPGSGFSLTAESISSEEEEAYFLVGVPDTDIQKILIPQRGAPYPMKTMTIDADIPYGTLAVTKMDASSGAPLPGATFELLNSSGAVIGTQATGADGVARFADLTPGTYTVREKNTPEGYLVAVPNTQSVTVAAGATASATFANQPIQGKIRIVKTDALTGAPLSGAGFTITRLSAPTSASGAGVGASFSLNTDVNGEADTGWLAWGRYRVEETGVPDGFIDNHFSVEIEAYENGKTYTVNVPNEPMTGLLSIRKTDRLDGQPIEGVQFDVYYDDAYGSGLACTMTTNRNGVALSEPLRKGKYIVKEHANPTGYVSELVTLDAEVRPDETTSLEADNQPIQGKIRIVKTDELTGAALSGAEFTITRVSGLPSHNGSGDGEVVAVLTTDANGVAESPLLTYGTYRVEETKVPEHYVDRHFATEIVIDQDNLQTYTVAVENEPSKGWIRLTKTDRLDGQPIEGVQFDIYYNDEYGEGLASTMTTDKNGVALSEPLRKGKYIVKEHANPTGYVSELTKLDAEVRPDETTHLSATNQPIQGRIRIIKTDELTGEALSGAEFTITRISGLPSHNGSGDGEVVAILTTDAHGVAVSPLLTWGTYRVVETKVPAHYVDNSFSTEVTIDVDNLNTYEVSVSNEPTKGWIRLTKTDRLNGNPIAGVKFDVYENDEYGSALACSIVTDENGVATTPPLRKGRYVVREHGATAGYVYEELTLDATIRSDETTDLTATNQPVLVRLKLYKRDVDEYEGDPAAVPTVRGDGILTGAVFRVLAGEDIADRQGHPLYSKGDVVVDSITTAGEDASVTTGPLWPGLYEITELTPPAGYQSASASVFVDARDAAKQSTEAVVTYDGVVTNNILYGAFAIVKLLGSGGSDPAPDRVEQPEPGAEFDVFLKSAGSYENAREFERDHIVTDKNGYAMTKALPYGIYTVQQTKGKDGYEIKGPIDVRITGTENLVNPPIVTLSDQPIRYRLRFIKTDAETGKTITLAHASFKLKDANGDYIKQKVYYPTEREIDTFVTDKSGSVTLPETVVWGLYFVEEVQAPEGYLIRDEDFSVFVGNSGDKPGETYQLDIEIPNEPVKGRILIEKKGLLLTGVNVKSDDYGNEVHAPVYEEGYLTGAAFEVRAAEDITGRDGTVWYEQGALADTITTTASGADASVELPLGRYELVEVSAPEGYIVDSAPLPVQLNYVDEKTALVEIHAAAANDYLPVELSLWKEKEEIQSVSSGKDEIVQVLTTTPGEGFVFGLFNAEDIRTNGVTIMADTLVATGTTDRNGKLTFSGHYPHGAYTIRELSGPDGWRISAESIAVSLTAEQKARDEDVIRVLLTTPIHNALIHGKITLTKTDITGQKTIPGALIEVSNDKGEVIVRAYTDEHGEIPDIPVTPGKYTFREILAPEGYALNEAIMSFEVGEDGTVTGDTVIRDDYTRVHLMKQDENGEPLEGVEFGLFDASGTQVQTALSDADGRGAFERVPYGTFVIREIKPLPCYVKNESEQLITVDGHFVNSAEPLATFINRHMKVRCIKVDTSGAPLEGVEFVLINARTDEIVESVTSDEQGVFEFTKIDYGDWIIRESHAPEGYNLMEDVTLHVDENWTEPEPITCVDIPNHYAFIKTDNRRDPLSGVRFALETEDGAFVRDDLVSGEDGVVHVTDLKPGKYVIREVETVEGYTVTEETIEITIDENYVVPKKLRRLKNYPTIQTGVDFELTPLTWTGIGMVGVGLGIATLCWTVRKTRRKGKKRK